MIELEHSPLGGSAAHRFLNCNFSFLEQRRQLQAGEFENVPSEFAERGTGAHELGAVCLTDASEPYEHIGKLFNGFKAGYPDGIELDAVAVYVAECRKLMDAHPGSQIFLEKTIHPPHIHELLKGTVDFGLVNASGAWLRDYKNGEGIGVGPIENEQLLYYAFLLVMSVPKLDDRLPVNLGIIQPNFYGVFEDPEVWETTVGYVKSWGWDVLLPSMNYLMAREVVMPDLLPDDDMQPGDWCQFCPVLLSCRKMQQSFTAYANASEDFVTMLSNEELNAFYEQRENARRFMKVLETTVHARLVGGGQIPSAKLVEKKTARVWSPGASAALMANLGKDAMTVPELKSPAVIEKMSTRAKELTKEWAYKPESAGLSVAPLSDPRPEAKRPDNAGVFQSYSQKPEELGW